MVNNKSFNFGFSIKRFNFDKFGKLAKQISAAQIKQANEAIWKIIFNSMRELSIVAQLREPSVTDCGEALCHAFNNQTRTNLIEAFQVEAMIGYFYEITYEKFGFVDLTEVVYAMNDITGVSIASSSSEALKYKSIVNSTKQKAAEEFKKLIGEKQAFQYSLKELMNIVKQSFDNVCDGETISLKFADALARKLITDFKDNPLKKFEPIDSPVFDFLGIWRAYLELIKYRKSIEENVKKRG